MVPVSPPSDAAILALQYAQEALHVIVRPWQSRLCKTSVESIAQVPRPLLHVRYECLVTGMAVCLLLQ